MTKLIACSLATALAALPLASHADMPGRGLTARFEVAFMEMTIDHHYSALRITELAAGTDPNRDPGGTMDEGTAPSPGFPHTAAKADLEDLQSLARRNNRSQREQILTLRTWLKDWYGIDHQPRLTKDGAAMIAVLERVPAGRAFDQAFLEVFSRHHYTLMEPVNACLTGIDPSHLPLHRLCETMWHSQISDIDFMRNELLDHFGIADYQPFRDLEPLGGTPGRPRGYFTPPAQ